MALTPVDGRIRQVTATIAASGTTSGEIGIASKERLVGIVMDSGWDAANITFTAAIDTGGTFLNVVDAAGDVVTVTSPAASEFVVINPVGLEALQYIKLVSSATQTAERTLTVILNRED